MSRSSDIALNAQAMLRAIVRHHGGDQKSIFKYTTRDQKTGGFIITAPPGINSKFVRERAELRRERDDGFIKLAKGMCIAVSATLVVIAATIYLTQPFWFAK